MGKNKEVARKRKRDRRRSDRQRAIGHAKKHERTAPLAELWKGKEFVEDGKGEDEKVDDRLKKLSIPELLTEFSSRFPDLVRVMRPIIVGRGCAMNARTRRQLGMALTSTAWAHWGEMPHFYPIAILTASQEFCLGCIAMEEVPVADGMVFRYKDFQPLLYLTKRGKVGSLCYRDYEIGKVICFVGSESPTLWLDALHSSSSSRTEATLGDDRAAVSLSMNTGTKEHGRSVMVRVGYFPVELDDEKAIITATDFLPLGAEGTPEYGTPGLEAMTGSPGLRDLVSALSNKETIFALAEKELNPLQTVGEGEDATLQPTFGPLQGFVTDSDERFEMMFSGL